MLSQVAFTSANSITGTLGKGVKYVKSVKFITKIQRRHWRCSVFMFFFFFFFFFLVCTYFTSFSSASFANFEQTKVSWADTILSNLETEILFVGSDEVGNYSAWCGFDLWLHHRQGTKAMH